MILYGISNEGVHQMAYVHGSNVFQYRRHSTRSKGPGLNSLNLYLSRSSENCRTGLYFKVSPLIHLSIIVNLLIILVWVHHVFSCDLDFIGLCPEQCCTCCDWPVPHDRTACEEVKYTSPVGPYQRKEIHFLAR